MTEKPEEFFLRIETPIPHASPPPVSHALDDGNGSGDNWYAAERYPYESLLKQEFIDNRKAKFNTEMLSPEKQMGFLNANNFGTSAEKDIPRAIISPTSESSACMTNWSEGTQIDEFDDFVESRLKSDTFSENFDDDEIVLGDEDGNQMETELTVNEPKVDDNNFAIDNVHLFIGTSKNRSKIAATMAPANGKAKFKRKSNGQKKQRKTRGTGRREPSLGKMNGNTTQYAFANEAYISVVDGDKLHEVCVLFVN